MARITGRFAETTASGEAVRAFVPQPLPPEPSLKYSKDLDTLLQRATARLSELRVASLLVPSPDLFNYAFVRKEAILSSQIEGVQATLTDLLTYESLRNNAMGVHPSSASKSEASRLSRKSSPLVSR